MMKARSTSPRMTENRKSISLNVKPRPAPTRTVQEKTFKNFRSHAGMTWAMAYLLSVHRQVPFTWGLGRLRSRQRRTLRRGSDPTPEPLYIRDDGQPPPVGDDLHAVLVGGLPLLKKPREPGHDRIGDDGLGIVEVGRVPVAGPDARLPDEVGADPAGPKQRG
jgi:hypothetical protein